MIYSILQVALVVGIGVFGLLIPHPYIFATCLVGIVLMEWHIKDVNAIKRHKQQMKALTAIAKRVSSSDRQKSPRGDN